MKQQDSRKFFEAFFSKLVGRIFPPHNGIENQPCAARRSTQDFTNGMRVTNQMKSIATPDLSMAGKKWAFPSEVVFSEEAIPLRRGASWRLQLPLCIVLLIGAIALAGMVGDFLAWLSHRLGVLLVFGGIGCWRWGWFTIQSWRAIIYRFWVYPRLRRMAAKAVAQNGPVPEVTILAVNDGAP